MFIEMHVYVHVGSSKLGNECYFSSYTKVHVPWCILPFQQMKSQLPKPRRSPADGSFIVQYISQLHNVGQNCIEHKLCLKKSKPVQSHYLHVADSFPT